MALGESAPAPPSIADAELMEAVVRGEREALATLYDRHAGLLLALAVRILHDRAQAEDLVHDVFLEAWHHARDFEPSRGTVRAWLVTRARSRALDRRAATERQVRVAEQSAAASAEAVEPTPETRIGDELVRRQVSALAPELIRVLELAYFEGLSSSEIAQRISVPIGTVKSRMARAMAALRERMGVIQGESS
jgi:RNA polymerase sigma-70 factor (ECF subfamily)